MEPGSLKQYAATAVPLLVSGDIMAAAPLATGMTLAHATATGIGAAMVASLGANLAASGLVALCKPREFLAGKRAIENFSPITTSCA